MTSIAVPNGEMIYDKALAWLVSLGQTEFGAAGTLLTALKMPRALIWNGTAQITADAKPARVFRARRLDEWSNPLPAVGDRVTVKGAPVTTQPYKVTAISEDGTVAELASGPLRFNEYVRNLAVKEG
jgi:hypothetical protein